MARRIRELRTDRGWSARELAAACADVLGADPASTGAAALASRDVIANIENGRRTTISVEELLVLAAVLDVAPVHLLVPVSADYGLQVGRWGVAAPLARQWVRGQRPLPSQDARNYRTEVPDDEWEQIEERIRARIEDDDGEILVPVTWRPTGGGAGDDEWFAVLDNEHDGAAVRRRDRT
ncbi:MAG: helix-turn-helix domain-containing protein [Actinomycetota bacterium]|nr:helix-turn-helix domain-containing protein [Actinomycetota bacterium]